VIGQPLAILPSLFSSTFGVNFNCFETPPSASSLHVLFLRLNCFYSFTFHSHSLPSALPNTLIHTLAFVFSFRSLLSRHENLPATRPSSFRYPRDNFPIRPVTMLFKSTLFVSLAAIAQLATATPPACFLAAIKYVTPTRATQLSNGDVWHGSSIREPGSQGE
jgi:hypothetical protein